MLPLRRYVNALLVVRICALLWGLGIATSSAAATFTGEFWNATSGFNNINQAIAFSENNAVTATFESTGIDYPNGGTNNVSSSSTLASFLGADAASIVGNSNATVQTSVFRFTGFVDLEPGTQQFIVGSDDGFQLTINDVRISQQSRPRGFANTTRNRNPGSGIVPFELFFYENFGNTGLEVFIDGQVAEASPIPIPAGLPLLLSAFAALGLLKWRGRSRFPLGKPA